MRYACAHAKSEESAYTATATTRICPRSVKSMPTPGTTFVLESRSANWSWPRARRAAMSWSFETPAGSCLPMTPSKMTFIALPAIFGPMTDSATEIEPSTTTSRRVPRSGRSRATSLRSVPLKSFDRSTGTERPMNPPPPIGRRLAKPAAPPAPPGRMPAPPCGRSIMPRPPRRAATRRSRGTRGWFP